MGPRLVLTKHLLNALVLIIFFIPNYPELSGLEQTTTISLFLSILSFRNLDSDQQGVVSWLPVVSAGTGAPKMFSALTRLVSRAECLKQRRLFRNVYKGLQLCTNGQILSVKGMELDWKLLHQPTVIPPYSVSITHGQHDPKTLNGKFQK